MVYPPRPNNISIPAVIAGNILQADDTSVSVIEDGHEGSIVFKTDNTLAMVINPQQKVALNTQLIDSCFTINNSSATTSTFRLSYQDSYYFDGFITENGNVSFSPSCDDINLNPNLITGFRKNFDVADHDGMSLGLRLGGILVTAAASELNYVDVPAGVGLPNKALVLNTDKNITGINRLDASLLTGTLLTRIQPNITELDTINVTGTLSIKGQIVDVNPETLRYLKVSEEGVAFPSKAMILDLNKNFTGINNLSARTLSGTLTAGPQPNITSLSALLSLTNNGPTNLNAGVTITTGGTDQLTIKYADGIYSTLDTNIVGDMVLNAVSARVKIAPACSFQIPSHNGTTSGLYLGSELVTASGTQLNYTNVVPGTAKPSRALVLDIANNIYGINILSAVSLVGTIQTGAQPMITSVNTLNIAKHNGTIGFALNGTMVNATADQLNYTNVAQGVATAGKAIVLNSSKSISGLNAISASTLEGTLITPEQLNITTVNTLTIVNHNGTTGLKLGNTLVTASAAELNRISVPEGIANASKALVVDGAKNIIGINNLTASNITGVIQTVKQPNINEVNTLHIANHNGTTTGLSLNGTLVTSTASQLNRVNVSPGVADKNKALVLDTSMSINGINVLNAVTLGGVLSNPTQPNIRNLSSIDIVDHNGINTGLLLNGELVISEAYQLNYVDVQQGVANASKAMVLDSTRNITNINTLTAINLGGTILTPSQPYITRVATLNIMNHDGVSNGLSLNGVLITATADQLNRLNATPGLAANNKALILDGSKNVNGINSLTAVTLVGTLSTAYQPNLTSVNSLNIASHNGASGLSLAGFVITATAEQINRLDTPIGVAAPSKALVVDSSTSISGIKSITATSISGQIQTSSQPNITSVSTLDITNHDGGSYGLKLKGGLVSATAAQLNYNSVAPGTANPLRALVTDTYNSISGINSLSSTKLISEQLALTGVISNFNTGGVVIKSYSFTDIIGRMIDIQLLQTLAFTNFQPSNYTSGYSSEIIGYIKPQYSESYRFYITCNDRVRLWVNGELLLHSWVGVSGSRLSSPIFLNAEQWVPIYIQYQVDVGSSPFFLLEWISNTVSKSQIATARMAWDNNPPAVSSKQFSQNAFTIYNTSTDTANTAKFSVDTGGDLTIDASGNDILLGSTDNLNIPGHNGTSRGLYLAGVLVQPTAYELNYLKVSPGTVSASHALVVDASKSIMGLNSITANSLACDNLSTNAFTISNLTLNGPLNNYNTGNLLIRQITGADAAGRIVNVDTINDINLTNYDPRGLNATFSLDIMGYILPQYTEAYKFYATANDRVRIWVADTLILNVWDSTSGLEYTSIPITLTTGVWVPIYIQFQNIVGTSSLQVRWSSTSLVKSFISSAYMAWDNSMVRPPRPISSADRITLFSSASGLTTVQTGSVTVDGNGNLGLSALGNVNVASGNNFNIISHNGTTGLQLAGTLVTASGSDINYLSGAIPGSATPLKALVLDSTKALGGISSITCNSILGTIQTPNQPNITSVGTLVSTLTTTSDIVINSINSLRFASDTYACYIQAGSSTTTNSSADLFIGNYGTPISTSSRKLMIKSTGFVGIQTSSPARTLSVNGEGATYCMRLINNSSNGSETTFCDLGVDTSSNLLIGSNLIIGASATATLSVNSTGIMKITPSGGSIQIGNANGSTLPLEVGSSLFTLNTLTGYINSEGSAGTTIPTATSYSIRTTSSIIVNGTVCITSDKRLKQGVEPLTYDECRSFILRSKPVRFTYINDSFKTPHCGLIAQEVAKTSFPELVKTAPCDGLKEETDVEGFVSPENASFNVSYEEIIPILMTSMKETINENALLKTHVYHLTAKLKSMEDRMKEMERMITNLSQRQL